MSIWNTRQRRGFSLIECCAVVLVLSMVGLTVGPSLQQVRSQMRGVASGSNLLSIGQGAGMYAADNQGRMFSYSWRAGEEYLMPDGRTRSFNSDQEAAAFQNQEILQRRTGRVFGQTKIRSSSARIPHRRFSHLVLVDYLDEPLGSTRFVDPADANQLFWTANPLEYLEDNNSLPYSNGIPNGYDSDSNWQLTAVIQRWTFASSYQNVPSAWQPDYPDPRYRPVQSTPHLFQGGNGIDLSTGRFMNQLLFPSYKVWMFEEFDREGAEDPYFAYDQARSEKLMFDGSVNSWASGDAYPSVVQEEGFPYSVWEQSYLPLETFPIPLGGLGDSTRLNQRYRWTFRGLIGVDYGPGDPDGR